jgi:hypothetical protein
MSVIELTEGEIDLVAGGYVGGAEAVCTLPGSGTFTTANGTLSYTSRTVFSNGATTMYLTDGSQYTTGPISNPYLRGLYINSVCNLPLRD